MYSSEVDKLKQRLNEVCRHDVFTISAECRCYKDSTPKPSIYRATSDMLPPASRTLDNEHLGDPNYTQVDWSKINNN
jgi:hypothetical protein